MSDRASHSVLLHARFPRWPMFELRAYEVAQSSAPTRTACKHAAQRRGVIVPRH